MLVLVNSCRQKVGYVIDCTIIGEEDELKNGEAYLFTLSRFELIRDTVKVKNGKFSFKGTIDTQCNTTIRVKGVRGFIRLFLENEKYKIEGTSIDLENAVIIGGESQGLYSLLNQQTADVNNRNQRESLRREIACNNPLSAFALDYLVDQSKVMRETFEVAEWLKLFKKDDRYNNNVNISVIEEMIDKKKFLDPGNPATLFTMNDINGNSIDVSVPIGANKLTLLYFWAGCNEESRAFNPVLLDIYKQYNSRGFEIIGISLDDISKEWNDAVKEDRLPWIQLSELSGTFSSLIPYYEINTLPQNILIDQSGKIVKNRLTSDELKEILDSKLPL